MIETESDLTFDEKSKRENHCKSQKSKIPEEPRDTFAGVRRMLVNNRKKAMQKPPVMPVVTQGVTGLAAILTYALEVKLYN